MSAEERRVFDSGSMAEGYRVHLEPVIFRPWAERLVAFAGLGQGQEVLDVAAGTGAVSRVAAAKVGAEGRVVASDVSPEMLALASARSDDHSCEIETLVCSATELRLVDASVDVVLCQQGFPFIADRVAASREMRRVLRPGGKAAVAVWLSGMRLDPFATYGEVLQSFGIPEPFPGAYDQARRSMSVDEVVSTLSAGGLENVEARKEQLTVAWASPESAALAIAGTPFGPALDALEPDVGNEVAAALLEAMTTAKGNVVTHVMTAVLGRGTRDP